MWNSDNVFSTLFPIWTLLQIFGMCHNSINGNISKDKIKKRKLLFKCVYNIIIISLAIYLINVNLQFTITKNINIITQLADILNTITNTIAMLTSIIFSLYYQDKFLFIINDINKLDEKLKRFSTWNTYKNTKIFIFIYFSVTFSTWISFFIYYVFVTCDNYKTTIKCIKTWFDKYIITKISEIFLAQFTIFLFIIMDKLKLLNNCILLLANNKTETENFSSINGNNDNNITIELLHKIYVNMLKIVENLHQIYSFPVLIKIANLFIIIFSSIYLTVFGYPAFDKFVKPQTFNEFLIPITYMLFPTFQLLIVAIIGELVTLQSRTTGKLIHRIPISRNNVMLMKRVSLIL